MKPDFRKSMVWLHTYSGMVLGWLLFTIFFTGTLSYFNPEITQWMQPELQQVASSQNSVNRSLAVLHEEGVNADTWRIYLPSERTQKWTIQWRHGRDSHSLDLGASLGSILMPRETAGGNFFRIFHYTLQLRGYGGRYIAGLAAMFMLVAVFSGIFTHRRFFRDFFTLRTGKLLKTLTDFHALAGIITIPFCVMICASGIMIYVIMYIPWSAEHFAGGERQLSRSLSPGLSQLDSTAPKAQPLIDFSVIQKRVNQQWPGEKQIAVITFEQPYRASGRIIVHRINEHTLSSQSERLVFSSHSGEPLPSYLPASTAANVRRVFFGLHEAHFASTALRWLLFLLGLLSSVLIASGLVIWLSKRLEKVKKRHIGHAVVERLNIAAISGLPLATAAYFMSNRVISLGVDNRAFIEVQVFLWVWLGCLLHSVMRPARQAWIEQLLVIAALCLSLPLLDIYQGPARFTHALFAWNSIYLGFYLFMFFSAFLSFKTARWLQTKPKIATPEKATPQIATPQIARLRAGRKA
ncbi:MAG: PepSY-associated TM helix domain-containing protein [Paraglaciecola chathamensis]